MMLGIALCSLLAAPAAEPADRYGDIRMKMVESQLVPRGIDDPAVLSAMRKTPRHLFIPEQYWAAAYQDGPVPIGHQQTISQPFVVAFMTQTLEVKAGHKVLEVGTGSGYQAAVLSELRAEVYSIEILEPLARWARKALETADYPIDEDSKDKGTIHLRTGDGYAGWPEAAPFDRIIVTAAPDHVPPKLKEQLKVGGRMILPVGDSRRQELVLIERTAEGYETRRVLPVMFVPMTGEAQGGSGTDSLQGE